MIVKRRPVTRGSKVNQCDRTATLKILTIPPQPKKDARARLVGDFGSALTNAIAMPKATSPTTRSAVSTIPGERRYQNQPNAGSAREGTRHPLGTRTRGIDIGCGIV